MIFNWFRKRYFTQKIPILKLRQEQHDAINSFRLKLEEGIYSFEDVTCLCGAAEARLLATRDRYALPVNTFLCKSCGVLWTNPQMTEKSLKVFYDVDYRPIYVGEEKASDAFFGEQVQHGKAVFAFVSKYIRASNGEQVNILDVGCGAGGVLIPFLNSGFNTYGCDFGSRYLEYGRQRGLVLEHGDSSSLSKYGSARLVILSHVLEHFKDPLGEILKLSYLIDDGGFIYIEVPGVFSIHKTYGEPFLYFQNAHMFHFTLDTLSSLLSFAGFELVEGDQSIRAIFRKCRTVPLRTGCEEYNKIRNYLMQLEIKSLIARIKSRFYSYILR